MSIHLRQHVSTRSSGQRTRVHAYTRTGARFSRRGARAMHPFARARHRRSPAGEAPANEANKTKETNGLILNGGWRYDLHGWLLDTFWFRGQGREPPRHGPTPAPLPPADQVL